MSRKICGYIAVRQAEVLATADVDVVDRIPIVDGLLYQGVDRDQWSILDELHHAGRLSPAEESFRQSLFANGQDSSGLELTRDLDNAKRVMSALVGADTKYDFIAVYAPELVDCKGAFSPEIELDFLGYDVLSLGEWSLIRAGIFCTMQLRDWINQLNSNGLFDSVDAVRSFRDRYVEIADDQRLEKIGGADNVIALEVLRPASTTG